MDIIWIYVWSSSSSSPTKQMRLRSYLSIKSHSLGSLFSVGFVFLAVFFLVGGVHSPASSSPLTTPKGDPFLLCVLRGRKALLFRRTLLLLLPLLKILSHFNHINYLAKLSRWPNFLCVCIYLPLSPSVHPGVLPAFCLSWEYNLRARNRDWGNANFKGDQKGRKKGERKNLMFAFFA